MCAYPHNHCGPVEGSNNFQVIATMRKVFDIDVENALAGGFSRNARAQTGSQCVSPIERPLRTSLFPLLVESSR